MYAIRSYYDGIGNLLVKEWITEKISNQIELLTKLAMNRRDSRKEIIKEAIETLKQQRENLSKLQIKSSRNNFV